MSQVTELVADHHGLTKAERAEKLPSGQQSVIANRVAWAKTYLKKAGLIANPARGMVRITEEGKRVLDSKLNRIDGALLERYETFREFKTKENPSVPGQAVPIATATPEESLEASFKTLRDTLAEELLDRVKACSPAFFEQMVVELLVAMGYGGSIADAGQAIGRSGDGGIDGVIKEDKLGLDVVCLQAKRWERTVGRPEVQAFAGSMEGVRARKGVLITTAAFSREAEEFVNRLERKVVLIDGQKLTQLMIDYNVGVSPSRSFVIKKVDLDYFEEEDV